MTREEMQARVLYRDGMMIIIDKPAGIAVHAGPGKGPNLEMYFEALRYGLAKNPGLAHRLDRDTSGCLILGRHHKALGRLGKMFAAGKIHKTYWAVVLGRLPQQAGRIDMPLSKLTPDFGWRMVPDPNGISAITEYRVLAEGGGKSFVELKPLTGRTHQLRVHLSALGCPIVGDSIYGIPGAWPQETLLHLHARSIHVPIYMEKPPVDVEAPLPAHWRKVMAELGQEMS
ncbi:MAG TPA: RNA pseudouridine synthase [Rhodospirillaceae bacterium]|nr:MAG: RNA pseudouridine synthase [Alphaproteobacteria bacterium GWF2_58_20]HAU28812.1 RNA pseudouridine synthase [Rhodospirillaceae bacterium]